MIVNHPSLVRQPCQDKNQQRKTKHSTAQHSTDSVAQHRSIKTAILTLQSTRFAATPSHPPFFHYPPSLSPPTSSTLRFCLLLVLDRFVSHRLAPSCFGIDTHGARLCPTSSVLSASTHCQLIRRLCRTALNLSTPSLSFRPRFAAKTTSFFRMLISAHWRDCVLS